MVELIARQSDCGQLLVALSAEQPRRAYASLCGPHRRVSISRDPKGGAKAQFELSAGARATPDNLPFKHIHVPCRARSVALTPLTTAAGFITNKFAQIVEKLCELWDGLLNCPGVVAIAHPIV